MQWNAEIGALGVVGEVAAFTALWVFRARAPLVSRHPDQRKAIAGAEQSIESGQSMSARQEGKDTVGHARGSFATRSQLSGVPRATSRIATWPRTASRCFGSKP